MGLATSKITPFSSFSSICAYLCGLLIFLGSSLWPPNLCGFIFQNIYWVANISSNNNNNFQTICEPSFQEHKFRIIFLVIKIFLAQLNYGQSCGCFKLSFVDQYANLELVIELCHSMWCQKAGWEIKFPERFDTALQRLNSQKASFLCFFFLGTKRWYFLPPLCRIYGNEFDLFDQTILKHCPVIRSPTAIIPSSRK